MPMRHQILDTPTGPFAVWETARGLRTGWLDAAGDDRLAGAVADEAFETDLVDRLRRYFAGEVVERSGGATAPLPRAPSSPRRDEPVAQTPQRT